MWSELIGTEQDSVQRATVVHIKIQELKATVLSESKLEVKDIRLSMSLLEYVDRS